MPSRGRLDLSHDQLDLALLLHGGPVLERWTVPSEAALIDSSSPLFRVISGDQVLTGHSPDARVWDIRAEDKEGSTQTMIAIAYTDSHLEVDLHLRVYHGTALVEQWVTVRNIGGRPVRIDRVDSFALHLPAAPYQLLSFSSAWGAEFEGTCRPLDGTVVLGSQSGRSSNGAHPFFALSRGDEKLAGSVAWSGNWTVRFEPDTRGYSVSGGVSGWQFHVELPPGGELEAPHVALALAAGDLDELAGQYHRVGRQHWYPANSTSRRLPLEWNHWWSYEDRSIDETAFRANVEAAARLGLELCTLDAGWFGDSDAGATWTDFRGDWDRVNRARFPSGMRALSDHVHERGLLFGLWCEIEGLGGQAALQASRPELAAMRDGVGLGYICFGCPDAREWAAATLERLITDYRCDWIKLDFNLDPGAGCNRTDHGHGPGDGLFAHYRGYYSVLDGVRARQPEVMLENCSSGGLRMDLGMMHHTHLTFLSDPDWPEHNLQVFWGATLMLAPEVCLQWGLSEWITPHPHQTFDPLDPALKPHQIDYRIRTALLGAAGFSLRLPDLPAWIAERVAFHAQLYKESIRRFVRDGDLYRLTGSPRRDGTGDRWSAFQYSLPEEHLLVVFRLPGAGRRRTLFPRGLKAEKRYQLTVLAGEHRRRRGSSLLDEGLPVDWLREEDSAIIFLREDDSE